LDSRTGAQRAHDRRSARRARRLPAHARTHRSREPVAHPRHERHARPHQEAGPRQARRVIVTRLHPSPHAHVDTTSPHATDTLVQWYHPPRYVWLRTNLVASANGSAAGSDGTSETLTAGADRRILGIIRRIADTVLVGAESVRAEGYVMPRTAKLVIVTASGD